MAFGLIDTAYIDWPSNVDATYLRSLVLRSGTQLTQVATLLDGALNRINNGVDAVLSGLLAAPQTTEFARGGATSRMKAERKSEYTVPRAQQVERSAHMLPINEFTLALGWTEDGLNEMALDDITMQVNSLVEAFEYLHTAEVLTRLFSDAEVPVDGNNTAITSPGFAGSGTGGNVFSGMYPNGMTLPGGYTHYYRDAAGNLAALMNTMVAQLRLWHTPPYDLLGSQSVINQITALGSAGGYYSAGSTLIRPADNVAVAQVDPGEYVGVFGDYVRVRQPRIEWTTDNFVIYKSYGAFNPRNPLAWRYDPLRGQDAYARSRTLFPLAEAIAVQKFGIGVNERTGAALGLLAGSGGYAPPVFSY